MTRLDAPETDEALHAVNANTESALAKTAICRRPCVPCLTARLKTNAGALPIPVCANCRWALAMMMSA